MKRTIFRVVSRLLLACCLLPFFAFPVFAETVAVSCTDTVDGITVREQTVRGKQYLFLPFTVEPTALCLDFPAKTVLSGTSGKTVTLSGGACDVTVLFGTVERGREYELKWNSGSASGSVTLVFSGSDVPVLSLGSTVEEINAVHRTKTMPTGITLDVLSTDEAEKMTGVSGSLHGRGNVSWGRAKKSYQITLDEKSTLLGMKKAKRWILIPSSADLSMVRSAVGLELAKELDTEYALDFRYVDLYLAGQYYGLYIVSEKDEIDMNRVDITDIEDAVEQAATDLYLAFGTEETRAKELARGKTLAGLSSVAEVSYSLDGKSAMLSADGKDVAVIDITGGYLLEFDNYDEEMQFKTREGCRVTIRSPETLAPRINSEVFDYLKEFMQDTEDAILEADNAEIVKRIDLPSFAKLWLINEFVSNYDATNNLHVWKESEITGDGKLHAGAAWDFDNIMDRDRDTPVSADKSKITTSGTGSAKWLGLLLRSQAFLDELVRQYAAYESVFTDGHVSDYMDATAKMIAASSKIDTIRWRGTPGFVGTDGSFTDFFTDADRAKSLAVIQSFADLREGHLKKRISGYTSYRVAGMDVLLGTGATLRFYASVPDGAACSMELRCGKTTKTAQPVADGNYYRFDFPDFPVADMGKQITATLFVNDRSADYEKTSVRDYLLRVSKETNDGALKALIADLVAYLSALQLFEDETLGESDTVGYGSGLTPTGAEPPYPTDGRGENDPDNAVDVSVVMMRKTPQIRFGLRLSGGERVTFTAEGIETDVTSSLRSADDGVLTFYSGAIPLSSPDLTYTLRVWRGDTLLADVCVSLHSFTGSDPAVARLAAAAYNYHRSIRNYLK